MSGNRPFREQRYLLGAYNSFAPRIVPTLEVSSVSFWGRLQTVGFRLGRLEAAVPDRDLRRYDLIRLDDRKSITKNFGTMRCNGNILIPDAHFPCNDDSGTADAKHRQQKRSYHNRA
jgi:hypothetical protein